MPPTKFLNFDSGIAKAIIILSAPIMETDKPVYREKQPFEAGFPLFFTHEGDAQSEFGTPKRARGAGVAL